MPVPTVITDLSTTAASNYPSGSDSPATLDDVQRAHAAFIAQIRDGTVAVAGTGLTGTASALSIGGNAATATTATNATNVTGTIASAATATTQTAGDNSTKVATTAYADTTASFHKFGAYQILSASGSISSGSIGGLALIDAASATVDMPAIPSAGKTVTIWNGLFSGAATLTTPGSESFVAVGAWGQPTMTLQPGEGITLLSNGTDWVQAGAGPIVDRGIGSSQTWQNVITTPGRSLGTTYTNSSGKPIMVAVSALANGIGGTLTATCGGVSLGSSGTSSLSSGASYGSFQFIVPNGATYVVTNASGMVLSSWAELRA